MKPRICAYARQAIRKVLFLVKKILSILCVFSLILGIGSINLTASAGTTDENKIEFVSFNRNASAYESDGKKGVRFYKESNGAYDYFIATTNYALESNKKYLISMDYNNAVIYYGEVGKRSLQPTIFLVDEQTNVSNDIIDKSNVSISSLYSEGYNNWRRVSFVVDTTGKVDDTHKYLSFAGKGGDGADTVDYAIRDISVTEIDDSFEFTSFNAHFGYIDDGVRQYADYTCTNTWYTGIGFAAKINVQPATEYMLMFDYKKSGGIGSTQFTIDGTKITDFSASDTAEWKTYSVKVKTPDTVTKQELKFSGSTSEGACSFSFDNFRMVPLDSKSIYPTLLKDFAYYQTDTNEYGWKFSSTATSYIDAGFVTDYALEPNSKYLIEFDYINPVGTWWSVPLQFCVAGNPDKWETFYSEKDNIDKRICSMNVSVKTEWTTNMIVLSTGDKVDGTNKYLGAYGKFAEGSLPQIAFKSLKVSKLSSDALYPTSLKAMTMYKTEDNELAWKFSPDGTAYVETGFSTGYTLEAGKAYAVSFDYKQPVSSWHPDFPLFFSAGGASFNLDALHNGGNTLGELKLSVTDEWVNKTVIIKPDDYLVYEGNNILWVAGKTIGLPDFAFKNLTVTEIDSSVALPNYERQFEYYLNKNNEVVWNFSKTSAAGEYSALGFATDYVLEKDKGYAVVFDYNYATRGWLNTGLHIKAMGSAFSEEDVPGSGNGLIDNDQYTGDGWATLKTAYKATDVTDAKKYFGLVAKTSESTEYDVSIKNIRLYELGDVNFDRKIDSEDLASLRKHLLGANTEIGFADANGDNDIDIRDLISVKKALSK